MIKDMDFTINLFTEEGDQFFDLLKAFIRDSKNSRWPHEIERKAFAERLFKKAIISFEDGIKATENRVGEGFRTEQDLKVLKEMKAKCEYWKKKYEQVTGTDY